MKTKQFFNKITNSSAFWMILSLLISLGMWTYLESKDIKPTEKVFEGIKVEPRGLQDDMDILDLSPSTVDFTIKGPSRLVNQLSAEDLGVIIDVSDLTAQAYTKKCTVILPDTLSEDEKSELQIEFKVNSMYTESNISFRLSNIKTVSVELVGSFEGELADNCRIGTVSFEPRRIELTGPEYYLNNVSYALFSFGESECFDSSFSEEQYSSVFPVNSETNTDNTGYQLILKTRDGEDYTSNRITYDSTLKLSMPVYRTEKFKIVVDDSNFLYASGASAENTFCSVSPAEIELSGIPSEMNGIEKVITLSPKIDTKSITEYDENLEAFVFRKNYKINVPEGLTNRTDTNEVTLEISIKDLVTKEFTVTQFSIVNPPEGYSAKVLTASITVTLRGPADVLDSITSRQIVAQIDLKGKAPGANPIYTPSIQVDGYDELLGPIGKTEQISIVFSEIETEA